MNDFPGNFMSDEDRIRRALRELAAEVPEPADGLHERVLAGAQTVRRRRVGVLVAAALVLPAVALAGSLGPHPGPRQVADGSTGAQRNSPSSSSTLQPSSSHSPQTHKKGHHGHSHGVPTQIPSPTSPTVGRGSKHHHHHHFHHHGGVGGPGVLEVNADPSDTLVVTGKEVVATVRWTVADAAVENAALTWGDGASDAKTNGDGCQPVVGTGDSTPAPGDSTAAASDPAAVTENSTTTAAEAPVESGENTFAHEYQAAGTYTVSVQVSTQGCTGEDQSGSDSFQVTVTDKPSPTATLPEETSSAPEPPPSEPTQSTSKPPTSKPPTPKPPTTSSPPAPAKSTEITPGPSGG